MVGVGNPRRGGGRGKVEEGESFTFFGACAREGEEGGGDERGGGQRGGVVGEVTRFAFALAAPCPWVGLGDLSSCFFSV